MAHNTLVYAFAPWGKNKVNISEKVLKKLKLPVDKLVLRVKYDEQVYLNILRQGYSQIIGLGQYPSGNQIRIEQVAHNIYGTKNTGYCPIDNGPATLHTDLAFSPTPNSQKNCEAGKFICNYSMYQLLKLKSAQQKFAFLHIPKDINVKIATVYVEEILSQKV